MADMKKNNYYIPLPKILKAYSKRLSKLRQEVSEMKHYWKIRCEERKVLENKLQKLRLTLDRTEKLEKNLGELLNRKHFRINSFKTHKKHSSEQCYPLFISHNEYTRLRSFLSKRLK